MTTPTLSEPTKTFSGSEKISNSWRSTGMENHKFLIGSQRFARSASYSTDSST